MEAEKIRDMIWDKPLPPFLKAISSHEHETLYHWIGEWAAEIAEAHKVEIDALEYAYDRWVEAEAEWKLTKGVLEAAIEAKDEAHGEEVKELIAVIQRLQDDDERMPKVLKRLSDTLGKLATAQAQVAVMAELLTHCEQQLCWPVAEDDPVPSSNLVERIAEVLDSAAPKVLWLGKLVSEYDDISEIVRYQNYISGDVEFFVEVSGKAQGSFSKEIEVIVLDKQGEGE